SIAAGVAAVVSAYPSLADHRVALGLVGILILTLGNLRGVRESGLLFAFPTYFFLASIAGLIGMGLFRLWTGQDVTAPTSHEFRESIHPLTLFLILRAFSGGCAAMTGTEAISNAVPAFRQPESRNAAITLTIMGCILGSIFLGISYLAYEIGVVPIETGQPGYQTVVSQIARATFEDTRYNWYYYVVQWATAIILFLAANTSFAGFPRLASIMARDRYMPRQLYNLGDRLVFSNGIIVLATLASVLIIVFHGDTHALIPLYAIGVFLSFTLSQWGMAVRFRRLREPGWHRKVVISTIGAIATAIVVVVQAVTKFVDGAYIVIILIVIFTWMFSKIHTHYIQVGDQLRLRPGDKFTPAHNTVLVLTPSLHRGILPALEYGKGLSDDVRAVHIETDPLDTILLEERWEKWGGGIPLVILESPYRSLVAPLLEYINEVKRERPNNVVTVIIPEFVPAKWWHRLLHNQSGLLLKFVLLFERGVVTANVRYYLER
ncbi:MAG: APC family permease, partial [Armatimonadota bacterium]